MVGRDYGANEAERDFEMVDPLEKEPGVEAWDYSEVKD